MKPQTTGFAAHLVALIIIASISYQLKAQELKCNIQINSQQIQTSNRTLFQTMQTAIYEFMNNTPWTSHVYAFDERIECNVMLTLKEQIGSDEYKGTLQVQARRPVYNSSYNTTTLNFLDENLHFKYLEYDKLEFSEATYQNNLTSTLAFYAYIILGIDYDTFSELGGTPYFEKAERIVNNAQNAAVKGWKAYENNRRNRYWMVENLLSSKYRPLRKVQYQYHRLGLDLMSEKPIEGRGQIAESLNTIQKLYRSKPDSYMFALQLFFDAKHDELVNIFSESLPAEKAKVVNILVEVDNGHASNYKTIMEK